MSDELKLDKIQILVNLIFFQLVWFATVYGPGIGIPWLGLPAVGVFIVYHFFRAATAGADFVLATASVLLGFVIETGYLRYDILVYEFNLPSPHFAPYWILVLWANFALTLNTGLRWLQGHYLASAALGFVGAPLAYFSGVKLGAAAPGVTPLAAYLAIAVSWAAVTPALLFLARWLRRWRT